MKSRLTATPALQWSDHIRTLLASYALAGGLVSLLGWALDLPRLTDWGSNGISIQPNACMAAILAGIGVLLVRNHAQLARLAGLGVAAIGILTLSQHVFSVNLGFDQWLMFDRQWGRQGVLFPGRMGPPGSLAWTLLGTGLILASLRPSLARFAPWLGLAVITISSLSLTGYLLGAEVLYTLPRVTIIGLQTATYLMALGIGLVLSQPAHEPLHTLISQTASGRLARYTAPFLIATPLLAGYLSVRGLEAGLYSPTLGMALLVLTLTIGCVLVLWRGIAAARDWEEARDVAENRRIAAEQARRSAEDRLGSALDNMSDAFVSIDRDWRYVYLNRRAEELIGKPRAAAVGQRIWDLVPEMAGGAVQRALEKAFRERTMVEFETFNPAVGNWFTGRIYPNPEGGVSLYLRDVTDRRRAREESFRRSQEARVLLHALPDSAIFVVDTSLRYVFADGDALRLTGASPEKFSGLSLHDAVGPVKAALYEPYFRRALQGEPFSLEEEVADRTFLSRGAPLRNELGEIYAVMTISYDITERKRAEIALKEADQRKDAFLATMAHELRNPLAPLLAGMEVLERVGTDGVQAEKIRGSMRRQLKHIVRLLDELLDISRISRDQLRLQRQPVQVRSALEQAVEQCQPMATANSHTLVVRLPDSSVYVDGDSVRLVQIFGNLLANACRYTPHGGRIDLSVEMDGGMLVVRVRDTGIGIPPHLLDDVFEMFSQVSPNGTRSGGGLGIGLSLVRRLVEMHGGSVTAHSDGPGTGSEFIVRLPVMAAPSMPERAPEPSQAAVRNPRRILVVDDNRDAAESLAVLLRLEGHEVMTAHDGVDALRLANAERPDAIILDIGLPGLNGTEVCTQIRQAPWGRASIIVAVSGWNLGTRKNLADDVEFDARLVKPVELSTLLEVLAAPRMSDSALSR